MFLNVVPLGAGQHFCPGLVKFMEPARHHLVCENERDANETRGGWSDILRFLAPLRSSALLLSFEPWQS